MNISSSNEHEKQLLRNGTCARDQRCNSASLVYFGHYIKGENTVEIYSGELEGEEGTGIKKTPKQLIQQGEITNNLCSEISYHPSKAQPRICLRTGAGAWPRCHSGGPCSSSATHLPCSPPAEQPRAQAQRKTSFRSLFTSIKLQWCFPLSVNAQNHKFTKVGEDLQAQSPTLPVLTKPGCSQFAC